MAVEFPESFLTLLEAAKREWAPLGRIHVIKNLAGGRSGAPVLHVDIDPGDAYDATISPGQYVLKMQEYKVWDNSPEPTENLRHRQAEAANADFARAHIPGLVKEFQNGQSVALLYQIAGSNLEDYCTGYAAYDSDAPSIHRIGQDMLFDLLAHWNQKVELRYGVTPHDLFRDWLGYRLNPSKARPLHEFVNALTAGQPTVVIQHENLINPLWLTDCDELTCEEVVISGLIHGDLHPGNLMLHREVASDPYWLIDFELSCQAPLGYDHAYFELALILRHLLGQDPERLFTLLKALEAPEGTKEAKHVAIKDAGLLDFLRLLRESANRWQQESQPQRGSSWRQQMYLARAAVGLNWANKRVDPGEPDHRLLAFSYGAWAARGYLAKYHATLWRNLGQSPKLVVSAAGAPPTTATDEAIAAVEALWTRFWEEADRFDESRSRYILVSGLAGSNPDLGSLGNLPWSAIIDLNPLSDEEGLFQHAVPVLKRLRSLHTFGKETQSAEFHRGTAWMMAGGWESRYEPTPGDFQAWLETYFTPIRELFEAIRREVAPMPVKLVVVPGDAADQEQLNQILFLAAATFKADIRVLLLGGNDQIGHNVKATRLPFAPDDFLASVRRMYGSGKEVPEPTVPGPEAKPVVLPIQRLRWLQEDLDVLHSRVLDEARGRTREDDEFWRGCQPTWLDLDQILDAPRAIHDDLVDSLREKLAESRNFTLPLYHHPGAGGTTVAYRAAWTLRAEYPTAVLLRYSPGTLERLDHLFHAAQSPVLLIADASVISAPDREKLYHGLVDRNARVVILYVVRTTQNDLNSQPPVLEPIGETKDDANRNRSRLVVADPLDDTEARQFFAIYSKRTRNSGRVAKLRQITFTSDDEEKRYCLPFFYGLYTYEEQFTSLDSYVKAHLAGIKHQVRSVILFLALVTRYSQTGIPVALVRKMLGLMADSPTKPEEVFGAGPSRLVLRQGERMKLMHPLIAAEVLRQGLGGETDDDCKEGLRALSDEFIDKVVQILGTGVDEVHHLFLQLFITRTMTSSTSDTRRELAELIEVMTDYGGYQILQKLTQACPEQAHYWNHLGRHHIYRLKQNFENAVEYLEKAVALSKNDALHHHTLGLVRRFWIEHKLEALNRTDVGCSAEKVLAEVDSLYNQAAINFFDTRRFNEADAHGYITHIQMVLTIAQAIKKASGTVEFAGLSSDNSKVARWLRENVTLAESLLERVRHLRGQSKRSDYERRCILRLNELYDNFDSIIQAWEVAISREPGDPHFTRALANAYFARKRRSWDKLDGSEIKRIVTLMEQILRQGPSNDADLRMWFQAYRRDPAFNVIIALARLEGWAARSDSLDAHYYLYILHYLNFRDGTEIDESLVERSLRRCRELAEGKRSQSYEWLALSPEWCPLAHFTELGEWNDREKFYPRTTNLRRIKGSIKTYETPQSGKIRISQHLTAFFVPSQAIGTPNLNEIVSFYLGFSYDGFRAWKVELETAGTERMAPRDDVEKARAAVVAPEAVARSNVAAQRDRAHELIRDLVAATEGAGMEVDADELQDRLQAVFRGRPVYERFGYDNFRDFLGEIAGIRVQNRKGLDLVKSAGRVARDTERQAVADYIGSMVAEFTGQNRTLALNFLEAQLRQHYPGPVPIYRRLGFPRLVDLITALPDVEFIRLPDGREVVDSVKASPEPPESRKAAPSVGVSKPGPKPPEGLDALREALYERVQSDALSLIDEAGELGLLVTTLDEQLRAKYDGSKRVWDRLCCADVRDFLATIDSVKIASRAGLERAYLGSPPSSVPPTIPAPEAYQSQIELRKRLETFIETRLARFAAQGRPYYLAQLGSDLRLEFPGAPSVYKRLGYDRLVTLLKTISSVRVAKVSGADRIERVTHPIPGWAFGSL